MRKFLIAVALCAASPAAFAAGPVCQANGAPVCALKSDGTRADYSNDCVAGQANAKVLHSGRCEAPGKEPAMCNMLYQPVCGANPAGGKEKTYPNLCHAEVANAHVLHDGECAVGKTGE